MPSSISSVSYQDILNLADYLNKSDEEKNNSSFEEKYKLMFANRNSNIGNTYSSDDIDSKDLEALLDALIQKNNTNWIGKNCDYGSAPSCYLSSNTFDNVQVYGRTIPVPQVPFSKCYYIPDDIGSNYTPPENYIINTNIKEYDCNASGSTDIHIIGGTHIHEHEHSPAHNDRHVHFIPSNS